MFRDNDYLSALLTEGPPAARCELVRHLASDDFGPRVLARLRDDDQPVTLRGITIADAAWARASKRLQALAGVRSAHIVPLIAYGRHEGLAYMIHEHEGGPRLTTLLAERDGRLPRHELLPIFAQVLLAVSEAHRQGVVVGGVRPQDVRLLPEDDGVLACVRNLGLAAVLGVPAGRAGSKDHPSKYRAPEPDVSRDPASDVYSLGVLFVRLLTGPLPSTIGETERHDMLRARLEDAQHDDPELDDDLVALMLAAVDPEPSTRPRTATRLLEALLGVVAAEQLGLSVVPELGPDPELAPALAVDDVPLRRSSRERTMQQQWDRPASASAPISVPASAPMLRDSGEISMPTPAARWIPAIATATATATASPAASVLSTPRVTIVRARGRSRSQRKTLRGLATGAGVLSTFTAIAIAATVAMGEPGTSPAPLPTASLAAATAHVQEPVVSESTVVIETSPPGVLTIDGKSMGTTPVRTAIPSGRHVIRVEADGYRTWRSILELSAGQVHQVAVALDAEPLVAQASLPQ